MLEISEMIERRLPGITAKVKSLKLKSTADWKGDRKATRLYNGKAVAFVNMYGDDEDEYED